MAVGIEALDQAGQYDELVQGLRQQYERLVGLVEGLGVHVEHLPKRKGKTGRLVDTGDDDEEEQADEYVALLWLRSQGHAILLFGVWGLTVYSGDQVWLCAATYCVWCPTTTRFNHSASR